MPMMLKSLPSLLLALLSTLCCYTVRVTAVPIELHGLNYNTRQGPDWDWEKCKSYEQVKTDLTLLSKLTQRFRVLSLTDCGQGEVVLAVAKELGLKLWLGLWVSKDPNVFQQEKDALESMVDRGLIDESTVLGITVGSESIYRKEVTVSEIIDLRKEIKSMLQDAGMDSLPVSIVDIAPTYEYNPQLTNAVDVIVTNSFPFWESIQIENSIDYLLSEINPILADANGKDLVLGETGWPSDGFISGVGKASPDLQREYFERFYCEIDQGRNWAYYYFTGIDNAWRQEQDPNNTIEGNWGFFNADLTLKDHFQNLVFTCPGSSVQHSFKEMDFSVQEFTAPPTTPAPTTRASCKAHSACAALDGDCCPDAAGNFLGCCDAPGSTPPPAPSPTATPTAAADESGSNTPVPSEAPVTDSSTPQPSQGTPSPTESPVADETPTPVPTDGTDDTSTPVPTDEPTAVSTTDEPTSMEIEPTDAPTTAATNTEKPTSDANDTTEVSPTPAPTASPVIFSPTTNALTASSATQRGVLFAGPLLLVFLMF